MDAYSILDAGPPELPDPIVDLDAAADAGRRRWKQVWQEAMDSLDALPNHPKKSAAKAAKERLEALKADVFDRLLGDTLADCAKRTEFMWDTTPPKDVSPAELKEWHNRREPRKKSLRSRAFAAAVVLNADTFDAKRFLEAKPRLSSTIGDHLRSVCGFIQESFFEQGALARYVIDAAAKWKFSSVDRNILFLLLRRRGISDADIRTKWNNAAENEADHLERHNVRDGVTYAAKFSERLYSALGGPYCDALALRDVAAILNSQGVSKLCQ